MTYKSLPTLPEFLPAESVEHPNHRALYDYWHRIRGDRTMPLRSDVSLKEIKLFLKRMHFYDVVDGGKGFRFRVIGTSVYMGLDQDLTGKMVSEHPDPGVRLRTLKLLQEVVQTKAPVRGFAKRLTGDELYDLYVDSLWLPFGEGDIIEQIAGIAEMSPMWRGQSD